MAADATADVTADDARVPTAAAASPPSAAETLQAVPLKEGANEAVAVAAAAAPAHDADLDAGG